MRHLFIGFNTASACERLGSGLPSACERLGSIGLTNKWAYVAVGKDWEDAIKIVIKFCTGITNKIVIVQFTNTSQMRVEKGR